MNITIPGIIAPVHSFDVYGVIIDTRRMSERAIDQYLQLAKKTGIAPEVSKKVIADYNALTHGAPWATGTQKVAIIEALNKPLEEAGIKTNYTGCFLEDGLQAIAQIIDAGENVILFSSGDTNEIRANMPDSLGLRITNAYDVSRFSFPITQGRRTKSDPAAFIELAGLEASLGRQVVSHTADELPELVAAVESHVIPSGNLVYVNRNNSNSKGAVLAMGISRYVGSLKEVDYSKMAR